MAYTTINKSTAHFNSVVYSGNAGTQGITGVGFQPDFTWIKNRAGSAENHALTDVVRGVTKTLSSNSDGSESTVADGLTAFGADGFTLGASDQFNGSSGRTYVGWNWKAGGAGSSNSDGSITSTVSANTTSGFSIVKYTGAGGTQTVGHGLGAIPEVVMVKRLDSSNSWIVWNKHTQGNNRYLVLNTNAAQATNSTFFQETPPTSDVFYVGNDAGINGGSNTYIAYCFKSINGFSHHGYFRGNGQADGSVIYTGFKPKLVIIKVAYASSGSDFTNHWFMFDDKLNGYNGNNEYLKCDANETISSSTNRIDILSNGFKCRTSNDGVNSASGVYTYMAFGQSIVGSNKIPCTAR